MTVRILKTSDKVICQKNIIYICGEPYACYSHDKVWLVKSPKIIGSISSEAKRYTAKLTAESSKTYVLNKFEKEIFEEGSKEKIALSDNVYYDSLAAVLAYRHYTLTNTHAKNSITSKTEQGNKSCNFEEILTRRQNELHAQNAPQETKTPTPEVQKSKLENINIDKPKFENAEKFEPQKKFEEYKKQQEKFEEQKYEEPKKNFTPPPMPTGTSSNGGEGSGCGFIAIPLLILSIIVAISMIPQSWRDLSTYIPEGDIGITICFFSSLIGGIVAVAISLFKKRPHFLECMNWFFRCCVGGMIINTIILIGEILNETTEFTGFFLFDIPLAFFAPLLGCFQFALPIGIVAAIISGIMCLIKK